MQKNCQAIVGFLVPRRSCRNPADTQCENCKTAICYSHAEIATAGALCPVCARPKELREFNLEQELYFNEDDLLNFAEQYRKQSRDQGDWVDFT